MSLHVIGNARTAPRVRVVVLVVVAQGAPLGEAGNRRVRPADLIERKAVRHRGLPRRARIRPTTTWWWVSKKSVEYLKTRKN